MPTDPAPRTALVLLAAGGSRRMGEPKQLLRLGGQTLLERAVDAALAAPVWPVVVVLGAHADRMRSLLARRPVLLAENPAWAEGMASSLRAGIELVETFSPRIEAVVMALCDQPGMEAGVLADLVERRPPHARGIAAAGYGGRLGAPACFGRAHFAALRGLTGDEGARRLLAAAAPEDLVVLERPELAADLDTPEDYRGHLAGGGLPNRPSNAAASPDAGPGR